MLRTRRLWISLIVAIVGVGLANATPARAAGGCSPASAPQIAPATTQSSDPAVCPDGTEYWAMSLQIGDSLSVSGSPTPSSGGANYMNLDIYGPNVQTIGQPLCNSDGNTSSFTETCMIPATGTYLLVSNEGSGQFTPTVNSAPASRAAAGGCAASSAPHVAASVTEYTNSEVCQSQGGNQYWAMSLQIGDTVTVNGTPTPSSGGANYMNLDIYGPNVQTIGQPLCNSDGNTSSFTETCMIPATGTYLLVSNEGSGTFTPRVNHPLLAVLHRVFSRWSPSARHSVLHVQASSPAATSVCMLIVLGWRALPRHLSCDNSHLVVLAAGRRVFTRAGRARVSVRFTRRARRLLTAHRLHRVTLIAVYTHRHRPPAIAAMRVRFRPR
jgi:hypothetical protein